MDLLYDVLEGGLAYQESGPPLWLTLISLVIVSIPVILLHELGHAIAAKRALRTEVEVTVGNAGRLTEVALGDISVELNALAAFAGRAGVAVFDDSRARARDIILIACAGPAASLLGTVVTALLLSAVPSGSLVHTLLWTATGVGAAAVVLNLIPMEITQRSGERWRTDGKLALDAYRTLEKLR
jgi:hypothetical protein